MSKGIFERRFGVAPTRFCTTKEVDDFVEKRLGRPLKVVRSRSQSFVRPQGNVFPVREYDVDKLVDDELRKSP